MTASPYPLKGLVFDIDGVIFDSRKANTSYYNMIRKAVGLPPMNAEDEDYCSMASARQSYERIIPVELREKALKAQHGCNYMEFVVPQLSLENGLLETLVWLQDWNIRLGISTNRANGVRELLRYFGIGNFFESVKTAASCAPKPSPQGLVEIAEEWGVPSASIAFLGDSITDCHAASAAGVPFWSFKNTRLEATLHVEDYFSLMDTIKDQVEREGQV